MARQNDNSPVQIIAPSSTQSAHAQVRVFVNGSVVNPGVYTLDSNSRITDALSAAGGVTGEATLDGGNLALRIKGEAEYYVPQLGETHPATSSLFKDGGSLGVSVGPRALDDADRVLGRDAGDLAAPCVRLSWKSRCPGSSLQFWPCQPCQPRNSTWPGRWQPHWLA